MNNLNKKAKTPNFYLNYKSKSSALLLAISSLFLAPEVSAVTRTWTGTDSDDFSDDSNWDTEEPGALDDAVIPMVAFPNYSPVIDGGDSETTANLYVNMGDFTVEGSGSSLTTGELRVNAASVTINNGSTVTADSAYVSGAAIVNVDGANFSTNSLTLSSNSKIYVTGLFGPGGVLKATSADSSILSGSQLRVFTAQAGGTLDLGSRSILMEPGAYLYIDSGSTLTNTGLTKIINTDPGSGALTYNIQVGTQGVDWEVYNASTTAQYISGTEVDDFIAASGAAATVYVAAGDDLQDSAVYSNTWVFNNASLDVSNGGNVTVDNADTTVTLEGSASIDLAGIGSKVAASDGVFQDFGNTTIDVSYDASLVLTSAATIALDETDLTVGSNGTSAASLFVSTVQAAEFKSIRAYETSDVAIDSNVLVQAATFDGTDASNKALLQLDSGSSSALRVENGTLNIGDTEISANNAGAVLQAYNADIVFTDSAGFAVQAGDEGNLKLIANGTISNADLSLVSISGATLAPGASSGQVSIATGMALQQDGTLEIEINDGTSFDIVRSDQVELAGNSRIDVIAGGLLIPGTLTLGQSFSIFQKLTNSAGVELVDNGTIVDGFQSGGMNYEFTLSEEGGEGVLTVTSITAVPEPTTGAALLSSLAVTMMRRRKPVK